MFILDFISDLICVTELVIAVFLGTISPLCFRDYLRQIGPNFANCWLFISAYQQKNAVMPKMREKRKIISTTQTNRTPIILVRSLATGSNFLEVHPWIVSVCVFFAFHVLRHSCVVCGVVHSAYTTTIITTTAREKKFTSVQEASE